MITNWKDIEGWFTDDEARAYNTIVSRFQNANFVEVGAWKGRSFASVIGTLLLNNYRNIYVVDHWLGAPTERTTSHLEATHTDVFQIFSDNLKQLGYDKKYNVLKMDSISASQKFEDNYFDVIFIDADHEYEGVKHDLLSWYPKLKSGGILSGHDYGHVPIMMALKEVIGLNHIRLGGSVWYHIKP